MLEAKTHSRTLHELDSDNRACHYSVEQKVHPFITPNPIPLIPQNNVDKHV